MTDLSYSDADYRADLLAMTLAMLPTLDRWLAEVGLSRAEAMALMQAGEPPPARPAVSADHRNRRADGEEVRRAQKSQAASSSAPVASRSPPTDGRRITVHPLTRQWHK